MTFDYTAEHDQDSVYFAYSLPYSYTDFMIDITDIEEKIMSEANEGQTTGLVVDGNAN